MLKRVITCFLSILFVVTLTPYKVNAMTNDLPDCVVLTHCVREDFKVSDLENAFKKAYKIVSETPRTKIIEKTDSYIHAEAKTKWRRYTDDLLLKAIPEKGIIQVRSESRVGIGDNGVNKKRVDDFAYRLMTERDNTN
ncbi:DUF1499 domain-containing protein [Prochlorococcus sp. MIT 0801]|uniref:DUF1499 domain-containing protein n=1 Tax=Prochlorococcus sp. MIT 0801 TaxID=1501269 RepID=UPI00056F0A37|nr:DUF1499 domain-containing protein [Prochlorococcus sp. MIT 0801]